MAAPGLSNSASVVGRHMAFLDESGRAPQKKRAVIIAYDPKAYANTVEFLENRKQKVVKLCSMQTIDAFVENVAILDSLTK